MDHKALARIQISRYFFGYLELWRYLENFEIFRKKMAVSRYLGHFFVIWTEFYNICLRKLLHLHFYHFFKDQSPMGDRFRTQFVVNPDVRINYILLYKIFWYFCILLTIASAQVEELQFLKVRNFRDILRYLENFWKYLENFWRYLELFSRISRKTLRPNLGIFVSEPT